MKTKFFMAALVAAGCATFANGAITIPTTNAGDGYFHDETGSSWDYFESSAGTVSAYYTFWGTSDTLQYNTGYLQFSLSSVPSESLIGAASLNLYLSESHYTSESPSAGFIRHATNSSSANGNASQRINGDVSLLEVKDQPVGWLVIDITPQLQADVTALRSYSAFSLNPNTSGYFRDAGFTINSSENAANQPFISVTFVPEPSSMVLLLISGTAMLRRRR